MCHDLFPTLQFIELDFYRDESISFRLSLALVTNNRTMKNEKATITDDRLRRNDNEDDVN